MPQRILIHAGFHKTGTTTVQRFLRANRVALRDHLALRLRWHLKDLLAATRSYSMTRDAVAMIKVQSRFGRLMQSLPKMPRRTLVLASEELLGHLPGRGSLSDYGAAPELLYTFWEIASTQFPNAKVEIYLSTRAPDPWCASAYWEHVKSSDMTLDFETFTKTYPAAARLDAVVSEVRSRVPTQVHSVSLETAQSFPLGPAEPILDLCDVPAQVRSRLIKVPPANLQADTSILERLLDVNRSTEGANRRKKLKAAILERAGMA